MQSMRAPEQIVDLDRYPITDLTGGGGASLAAKCHRDFDRSGLCLLPNFIRPEALAAMAAETASITDRAYYCHSSHNAYLEPDDPRLPPDHPRRRREETHVGSIAYDLFPRESTLQRLYEWDPLKDLVAAVLGKPRLFRLADPLGACSVNVFRDGGRHAWHFDESEFTITIMLQPPKEGGTFEYVPAIRGRDDEYQRVDRILKGGSEGVVRLPFTPGTLLIFGGQKTLHRVTEVSGDRPRLVPVLCYSAVPGLENSDEVRKLFWGRTGREARP